MSIVKIRERYPLAKVGGRVARGDRRGTIVGTAGTLLKVRFDGERHWQTVPPGDVTYEGGRPA